MTQTITHAMVHNSLQQCCMLTLGLSCALSTLFCDQVRGQEEVPSSRSSMALTESSLAVTTPPKLNLNALIREVIAKHPSARAKRFEVDAARWGFKAARETLAPQLSGTFDLSDDLVTLPNPLEMGKRTPFETRRYNAEVSLIKPLQWGTRLGFGVRQGQVETTRKM